MSDPTISTTTAGTTVRPAKYGGGRKQATSIFGAKKSGPSKSKKRKM